jgi:hypothetical protein
VEVFDGPTDKSPKLGKYCGQLKPSIRPSTGHQMMIRFVADATVKRTGFRVKYYGKDSKCLLVINNLDRKYSNASI